MMSIKRALKWVENKVMTPDEYGMGELNMTGIILGIIVVMTIVVIQHLIFN